MVIGGETFEPAVPRLPVGAAVRRAALSPAPGHVATAAAGGATRPRPTVARRAGLPPIAEPEARAAAAGATLTSAAAGNRRSAGRALTARR